MSHLLCPNCHPGYGCFTCPHKDCIRPVSASGYATKEETAMRAAGNKRKAGRRTSFGSICMVIIGK